MAPRHADHDVVIDEALDQAELVLLERRISAREQLFVRLAGGLRWLGIGHQVLLPIAPGCAAGCLPVGTTHWYILPTPATDQASDHYPVIADFDVDMDSFAQPGPATDDSSTHISACSRQL